MRLLPFARLFLPFVFYENVLYLCKTIIDKNSYEAKTTYISGFGNRSSNGASCGNNIIPFEWCYWRAIKFSSICHGRLLCCSQIHLSHLHFSVGAYNCHSRVITPELNTVQQADQRKICLCKHFVCNRQQWCSNEADGAIPLRVPAWGTTISSAKRKRRRRKTASRIAIHSKHIPKIRF